MKRLFSLLLLLLLPSAAFAVANRQSVIRSDVLVDGTFGVTGTLSVPDGTIKDAAVNADAAIQATKLVHQFPVGGCLVEASTAITAISKDVHIVQGATATLVSIQAAIDTAADDVSRTVTVDLQKSTGGGAFATVLSATVGFTSSSTVRTASAGTLSSTALVQGDILRVVVTVAGGSGNQAKGLVVTVFMREDPS